MSSHKYSPSGKNDNSVKVEPDRMVGITLDVSIRGINGDNPIRAKVDTGAQSCSLHASDIEVTTSEITHQSQVKFKYEQYQYNMNVDGFQSISSADGGTTNRPFVKLDVNINDQYIPQVIFNLNDRSNMDYPVLIGMNLIEAAKFVIDPTIKEMDVSFGPEGMSIVSDETSQNSDINNPSVDKNVDVSYNDSNVDLLAGFKTYLEINKDKPLGEVVNEIMTFLKSNKAPLPDDTID